MINSHSRYVIGLLILSVIIRVATIHYGTNTDEGVYWVEGKQIFDGYVIYKDTQFNKTPLVALVAAPFFFLGDAPIYPMRAVMLLFSCFGLYAIYRLCLELFDQKTSIIVLALLVFEPFSAVWAKYLHTSTWTPWFEAIILWLLIAALKQNNLKKLFTSGIVLGIYALSKQSAIYLLPIGLFTWLLFAQNKTWRRFLVDTAVWGGGAAIIFLPFLLIIWLLGAFPAMWHDIWESHHKIAEWFAHHTMAFKMNEWWSIIRLAPFLWLPALLSPLLAFNSAKRKSLLFVWIWFLIELLGNVIFFSHVWRHYFLYLMPPVAMLSALVFHQLLQLFNRFCQSDGLQQVFASNFVRVILVIVLMVPFWGRNDWFYPGITIEQERNLAIFVSRNSETPYLLNLTNPSLYIWADKEIPMVYQGNRQTRIPYFLTLAGRGYLTKDEMQQTVDHWQTLPIDCVVMFARYYPEIFIEPQPYVEPLRDFLLEHFEEGKLIEYTPSTYGRLILYVRKSP